jgi:CRP/FNR family transcriptional regulator, transcriptional activator FtrB
MGAMGGGELRRLWLFSGMAKDHVDTLLDAARVIQLPARAPVFIEGASAEFLHILLDGTVELFAQMGEQESTIGLLRPKSAFVLAAVAGGGPYLASARTVEGSRVLLLPATAVREAFDRDREFARAVARGLSNEFNGTLNDLKNQKLRSSMERVADWLLRADAQFGNRRRFTLPVDKRTLASQLGMTPEHLSRNLKCLSGHGVVVAGRKIVLEDPAALAAVARHRRDLDGLGS